MIFQKILISIFALATMVLIYMNKKEISALLIVQTTVPEKSLEIIHNNYDIDTKINNKNEYFILKI